jgi:hypothetical protein
MVIIAKTSNKISIINQKERYINQKEHFIDASDSE